VESRQIGDLQIHRWMTVDEVASRCHVSEAQVFAVLKIDPVPGDEKLPLRALENKYHKTEEEMRKGLLILIDSSRGKGDHHHE